MSEITDETNTVDVQFVRFSGGKVHVYRDLAVLDVETVRWRPLRDDDEMGMWIMAHQRGWCGRVAPTAGLHGISSFPDELICGACVKAWPHNPLLLFEHPMELA